MSFSVRWPTRIAESTLLELARLNPGTVEMTADGTLIMTPPTGSNASLGEAELFKQVDKWHESHVPEDIVLPATGGITLPDESMWGPDATWIPRIVYDRMSDDDRNRSFWKLLPGAVFELLSPSDSFNSVEFQKKLAAYRDNIIPLIVVIERKLKRSLTYRNGNEPEESFAPRLDLGDFMPNFILNVDAILKAKP